MLKNRAQILDLVATDNYYIQYCKKVCGGKDIYKDLWQYIFLYLCELPEAKLIEISKGNLKGYITRIIYLNANFKTTGFYKNNIFAEGDLPQNIDIIDDSEAEAENEINKQKKYKKIEEVLESEKKKTNSYAWNVALFNLWVDAGSYLQTAKKTKIPYPTVRHQVLNILNKIKSK